MNPEPRERALLGLLLAAACFLLWTRLDATGVWAPDEPRFAQVADEMRALERGPVDLVVLRLNDEVYTQKPPFYYWLVAALGATQGRVSEWMARLPSAIAGVLGIWVCVRLAFALTGRFGVGLWSGAILLTVFRYGHLARRAQLDILLTLFFCVAMWAIWELVGSGASSGEGEGRRRRWLAVLHGALGLALLTKGPVGLLPIAIAAIYLGWDGRLGALRTLLRAWGFALSLGPTLAWVGAAVALTPAGYFDEAIVDNVFRRFATGTSHIRPFYYYGIQFPLEFLPWTFLWPWVAIQARRDARAAEPTDVQRVDVAARRFLLIWVATLFVFFSISAGKRGLYLMPAFPAAAILCGMAVERGLARGRPPHWVAAALAALALAVVAFAIGIVTRGGLALDAAPGFVVPPAVGVGLVLAVVAGVAAGALAWTRPAPAPFVGVVIATVLAVEWVAFAIAYPAFDAEKSPRPIAVAAASVTPEGRPIAVFDHRELVGGIRYYADRPIVHAATPQDVAHYFASGGTGLIIKARKLPWLDSQGPFETLARSRSGRRELLLVRPVVRRDTGTRPAHPDANLHTHAPANGAMTP